MVQTRAILGPLLGMSHDQSVLPSRSRRCTSEAAAEAELRTRVARRFQPANRDQLRSILMPTVATQILNCTNCGTELVWNLERPPISRAMARSNVTHAAGPPYFAATCPDCRQRHWIPLGEATTDAR
jgi:hypothetical protein